MYISVTPLARDNVKNDVDPDQITPSDFDFTIAVVVSLAKFAVIIHAWEKRSSFQMGGNFSLLAYIACIPTFVFYTFFWILWQ